MKNFFKALPEIKNKIARSKGVLLMLDFDGTLSPIAPTPKEAILSSAVKAELKKISESLPTIIVSGRSLIDLKNKIKIKTINYSGNHGLQWEINGERRCLANIKQAAMIIKKIKRRFNIIVKKYPGILLEDKIFTLAIHYRRLAVPFLPKFKKDIQKIIDPAINTYQLRILKGKKVTELIPDIDWNKGKCAELILQTFQNKFKNKLVPIYVGDDITDEYAFSSLRKGITVRVGKNKKSQAEYFIKDSRQIILLLGSFKNTLTPPIKSAILPK